MESLDSDILIIGGGVAGSAMACSLKNKGYKVILVEKSDKPQDTARGDHIQPSVCEILERWNVLNDFIEAGAQKRAGSLWYDEHGNFLMDANVSKLNIPHPYFLYLNHENISEVLLDSVSSDKKFHMYRPILQCTHIESNENRSMFKLVLKDKTEYEISTKLIVGADGIASNISKTFSIERESFRYERALAVLFSKDYQLDEVNNLKTFLTDRGIVTMIPRANGGCKVGLTIGREEVKEWKKLTPEQYGEVISGLVPSLKDITVENAGIYPPTMIKANQWTKNNLVLIGDACHGLHPGRSQGMNTTIKCIDQLMEFLPKPDSFEIDEIKQALSAYETQARPEIEDLLRKNHQIGLSMDNFDHQSKVDEINKYIELEKNDKAAHDYRMNSAGYGMNS